MKIWSREFESSKTISPFVPACFLKGKYVCLIQKKEFLSRPGRPFRQADHVNVVIPLGEKI